MSQSSLGGSAGDHRSCYTRTSVAVAGRIGITYPADPPFHPSESYPEYPFQADDLSQIPNHAYAVVRECLRLLGLDRERFGQESWNPLGEIIKAGDHVLIKPNAVLDIHLSGDDLFSVVTHASVIRAVIDYVLIALGGRGKVSIADAPQFNADFENYIKATGLQKVVDFFRMRDMPGVEILDLRRWSARLDESLGIYTQRSRSDLAGDPLGYSEIDLGPLSMLTDLPGLDRLYGADFDYTMTRKNHNGLHHMYLIANSVLDADVIVSIPKLKTHRKTGASLNIKGLVGTNGDKNYLAHYRVGPPSSGGDEYPDGKEALRHISLQYQRFSSKWLLTHNRRFLEHSFVLLEKIRAFAARFSRRIGVLAPRKSGVSDIAYGNWSGNDTAWRMAVDLLRIVMYSDRAGIVCSEPQRRFFCLLDGITAGEGEGPLAPTPRLFGRVIAGTNPVAVDVTGASVMGIEPRTLRILRCFQDGRADWALCRDFDAIAVSLPGMDTPCKPGGIRLGDLPFRMPSGW